MNSFSLWFIPPPNIKKQFQEVISDLSAKYQSPNFKPHITLLGEITGSKSHVLKKTKILALKIKPFSVTFSEISFSTTYFQCVFARVKSQAALMDANLKAKEIFDVSNNVYMPHLSLLYGDHNMETREKIVSELKVPTNLSFRADKIIVVPCTQNPADWRHLAELRF